MPFASNDRIFKKLPPTWELLLSSFIAFASTNLDDLFVLMLFFANSKYKASEIVWGQYVGISPLIALSFLGSFIGVFLPTYIIGLWGVLPIYLGIKGLVSYSERARRGNRYR